MKYKLQDGTIVDGNNWIKVTDKVTYPEETGLDPKGNLVTVPEYTKDEIIQVQLEYASQDDLDKWNITLIVEDITAPVNGKFYYTSGDGPIIPKNLEEVRKIIIEEIKQTASGLLQNTDWIIIKSMELGINVNSEILQERSTIRSKSNQFESQTLNCSTIEELESWYNIPREWK